MRSCTTFEVRILRYFQWFMDYLNTINLDDLGLTSFFRDAGDDDNTVFAAVKELLNAVNYIDIKMSWLKVGYLDLGRPEKESLLFDTEQKSFQQCWMGAKDKRGQEWQKQGCVADLPGCSDKVVIQRDSLIPCIAERGRHHACSLFSIKHASTPEVSFSVHLVDQFMQGCGWLILHAVCMHT